VDLVELQNKYPRSRRAKATASISHVPDEPVNANCCTISFSPFPSAKVVDVGGMAAAGPDTMLVVVDTLGAGGLIDVVGAFELDGGGATVDVVVEAPAVVVTVGGGVRAIEVVGTGPVGSQFKQTRPTSTESGATIGAWTIVTRVMSSCLETGND